MSRSRSMADLCDVEPERRERSHSDRLRAKASMASPAIEMHDFIQMPFVAAGGSPLADLIGDCLAKLGRPLAHGLVSHTNPSCREHLLDHAKAQGKPEVEPNGMADDLGRKAIAVIEGITRGRHSPRLPRYPPQIR